MNASRQFLDALVRTRGEELVINRDEPPHIFRGGQKGYLLKSRLNDEAIQRDADRQGVGQPHDERLPGRPG